MTENLHARLSILPPKINQAVAQYAEVRWPTSATYKRKGTVKSKRNAGPQATEQRGFLALFSLGKIIFFWSPGTATSGA